MPTAEELAGKTANIQQLATYFAKKHAFPVEWTPEEGGPTFTGTFTLRPKSVVDDERINGSIAQQCAAEGARYEHFSPESIRVKRARAVCGILLTGKPDWFEKVPATNTTTELYLAILYEHERYEATFRLVGGGMGPAIAGRPTVVVRSPLDAVDGPAAG